MVKTRVLLSLFWTMPRIIYHGLKSAFADMTSSDPQTAPICTQCRYWYPCVTHEEKGACKSGAHLKILAGHRQWHLSFCPVLLMSRTPSVQLVSIANLPRASRADGHLILVDIAACFPAFCFFFPLWVDLLRRGVKKQDQGAWSHNLAWVPAKNDGYTNY